MGPFEKFVRSTKTFKKVVNEYARITEQNFETIKRQDEDIWDLHATIARLREESRHKDEDIEAVRKRYANIPDAAKHMAVVSECERLKFLNTQLEDDLRTLRQELFDLKNPGILKPVTPKPVNKNVNVKDVVVLETLAPVKKTTKTKTKAKKAPKLARGTPRKRGS